MEERAFLLELEISGQMPAFQWYCKAHRLAALRAEILSCKLIRLREAQQLEGLSHAEY